MLAATLTWGLCGSVFINCSRTLFQEASPSDQRARVLAIYQLGFMGAGPIGALLAGALSAEIGTLGALRVFAAAMFVVVSLVAAVAMSGSSLLVILNALRAHRGARGFG